MKYMGSKRRIVKDILPIILQHKHENQTFYDICCGSCKIVEKVSGKRVAVDINPYLIEFLKCLQVGWLPPEYISESYYLDIKSNVEKYPKALVGYVGFQLSFGSVWFGSYRRDNKGLRDYSKEAFNSVKNSKEKLKGIIFINGSYDTVLYDDKSIIYIDPPYKGTYKYKGTPEFDHDKFWQWCREMTIKGHKVFISEYNAPKDFDCIWEKEINSKLNPNVPSKSTEKLFVYTWCLDLNF